MATEKGRGHGVWHTIQAVAIANFFVFMVIGIVIGGHALAGKVEAGRYYLGDRGIFREVGPVVYFYSLIHTVSQFILMPLAIGGVVWQRFGDLGGGRRGG